MLQIGDFLCGNYEITGKIGSGGGGIIFKANHIRMKKTVALKLIKENVKGIVENRAEVDILKNLKNDYLPQVLDFVEDNGDVYTVMEYIEGQDLSALIKSGMQFNEKSVIKYAVQLCNAVEYLHGQNPPIIHSDIKPANIMLTPDDKICLIDFNISLVTNGDGAYSLGGSKGFAAPEQFRKIIDAPITVDEFHEQTRFINVNDLTEPMVENETTALIGDKTELLDSDDKTELLNVKNQVISDRKVLTAKTKDVSMAYIDTRTDIYGIGASLYYIVTSRLPADGNLDFRGIKISKRLRRIIEKAMAQNPDDRYKSVSEMKKDIEKNGTVKLNLKVLVAVSAVIVAVMATIIIYPIVHVEMNTRAKAYSYGNEFVIEKAQNKELMGKQLSNKYNATAVSLMQQAYNYYNSLGFEECSKYIAISQDAIDNIKEYNPNFEENYTGRMEINKLDPDSGDLYEYLLNNFTNYTGKDELYILYSLSDGKINYMYVSDDPNLYEAAMNGVAIQGNLGVATTTTVNDIGISDIDSLLLKNHLHIDSYIDSLDSEMGNGSNINQENGIANETDVSNTKNNHKETEFEKQISESEQNELVTFDDPKDYMFSLDGVIYQLPFAYKELADAGWKIYNVGIWRPWEETDEISSMQLIHCTMKKGETIIDVEIFNPTGNVQRVQECKICTIMVDGNAEVEFEIAKGIHCQSTIDKVQEAFGAPDSYDTDTVNNGEIREYQFDSSNIYEHMVIKIYDNTKLNSIELKNLVVTEDDTTEISTEVPAYLSEYVTPSDIGADPTVPIFELDGITYTLPCPLTAFTDNGWTVSSKNVNSLGGWNLETNVLTISKGESKKINLDMGNFAKYSTLVENCAVVGIKFDTYSLKKVPGDFVKFPGGLTMGSSLEELYEACRKFEVYESESGSVSFSYNVDYSYSPCIKYYFSTSGELSVDIENRTWQ